MNRSKLFKIPLLAIAITFGLSSFIVDNSEVKSTNISYSITINKSANEVFNEIVNHKRFNDFLHLE